MTESLTGRRDPIADSATGRKCTRMLRATAAGRLLLLAGAACGQAACGTAPVGSPARPAALVQRPDFGEFHQLRGQWRGMEVDGTSPTQLKLCTSRPGVHVRALSYEVSSPSIRCFRLTRISDQPVAAELLPVEKEDTRHK